MQLADSLCVAPVTEFCLSTTLVFTLIRLHERQYGCTGIASYAGEWWRVVTTMQFAYNSFPFSLAL
jgi:hypothetical protein